MSALRAFIYVQHLLGIGHLKRAAALARALAGAGHEVTLASGGLPVPGIALGKAKLVQLPPVSAADIEFKSLVDAEGHGVDDAWKAARAAALLAAWRTSGANLLVLELFPFGRRQMRFELLPLLEEVFAMPRRATVLCSVRDILGGLKSEERRAEALDLARRRFDGVLVHGDPAVIAFGRSFAPAGGIADRLHYTGYLVEADTAAGGDAGRGEVIVSAGGGAVGAQLLETALLARPLSALRDRNWRLLAGDNLPEADHRRLAVLAGAASGVILERSRRDFTTLLANCTLSISQAGYNTLLETVQARARAVVVPFAAGRETEQALRARCFAERGLVGLVEEAALTPETLAAAADAAAAGPHPTPGAIDLDGARNSVAIAERIVRERAA